MSRIDPDGHNYFYVHNKNGDAWEWHDGSDYNGQHSDYTNLLTINVSAPDENGRRSATLTLYGENWKQEIQENGYVGAEGARGNEPVRAGEYFVNVGNYTTTSAIIKDKNQYVLAPSKEGVQIVEPPVLRDKNGIPITKKTVYGYSNTYDLFRQIWGTKRANLSAATWVDGQPTYSPGHGTVWYIHGHDSLARGQNTLGCVGTPEERMLNWLTNSATGKTSYNSKTPLPVSVKY